MVESEKVNSSKVTSASTALVQGKGGEVTASTDKLNKKSNLQRTTSAYYIFASLPQVVHSIRPKTGYRNNVSRPRGAHDYFNVMWDPHVYRGSTTTLTSSLKQPESETKSDERYRKRRSFANAGNGVQTQLNTGTSNGYNTTNTSTSPAITNRNRYRMTTKVTSRSRTFPPPHNLEGRHQVHVQTEELLEDLTKDIQRPEVDATVQTDPIEDDVLESSPKGTLTQPDGKRRFLIPERLGVDASTQVLPGELISFDEQVQPIVEAVVGKILEQALMETMEEEEIRALKAQQNRFVEKRKEEERELKRLQEQQERVSAEKERLKRHLEAQLERRQNGDTEATMMGDGTGAGQGDGMMSTSYLLELLPSVINSLRQEGLLTDQLGDDVLTSFVPMWSSTSKPESDPTDLDDDCANEPFPDGYHSRVNSLDGVVIEHTDIQKALEKLHSTLSEHKPENDDGEDEPAPESDTVAEDSTEKIPSPVPPSDETEDGSTSPQEEVIEEAEESAVKVTEDEEANNEDGEEDEVSVNSDLDDEDVDEEIVVLMGRDEEDDEDEKTNNNDNVSRRTSNSGDGNGNNDISPGEVGESPLPQVALSSQLPNGAIPNIESRQSVLQD